ncbi:MAG TPA: YXWGXW repeat-containing protein [Polyangiaceae bacterium]|nr:YXWGXW repeat-containing protein [Polyangiaceae bacterium]
MLKRELLVVAALLATGSVAAAQPAVTVGVDVSPEERAYQSRTDARLRGWLHEGNRATTDEEREFVKAHWARAAKIWRIRHLAAEAKDTATVARCDRLLARADQILEQQIRRLSEHAPVLTAPPVDVEITTPPPPVRVEVRPPPPSPHHVWVPGFWAWQHNRHAWVGGHWAEPPQDGMTWEEPKWENRGGRWVFDEGRWHPVTPPAPTVVYEPPPPPPQEVVVQAPPPPPRIEVRPPGPSNAVWIPGYWHWNGQRHVWVGGRWSAPRGGFHWEPDRWENTPHGWRRIPGHWQR